MAASAEETSLLHSQPRDGKTWFMLAAGLAVAAGETFRETPGNSDHEVRDLLGHANISTTSRYLGSTPDSRERAMLRFEAHQLGSSRPTVQPKNCHTATECDNQTAPISAEAEGSEALEAKRLMCWCRGTELNRRHYDFQSYALPTELPRHREDGAAQARLPTITEPAPATQDLHAVHTPRTRGDTHVEREGRAGPWPKTTALRKASRRGRQFRGACRVRAVPSPQGP